MACKSCTAAQLGCLPLNSVLQAHWQGQRTCTTSPQARQIQYTEKDRTQNCIPITHLYNLHPGNDNH